MGLARPPAQGLGVSLFCSLNPEAVTISAQEMGLDYGVLYNTSSVLYIGVNMLSARDLGVPLLCSIYGGTIFAREVGSNYGALSGTILPDMLNESVSHGFTKNPCSTIECLCPQFIVQVDDVKGVIDLGRTDDHNVGVHIITSVLRLRIFWS